MTQPLLSFWHSCTNGEIMTRHYVFIDPHQKRKAVEIGARYDIPHIPAEYGKGSESRMPAFFPATRGVEFHGTLSQIERHALVFTDVEVP